MSRVINTDSTGKKRNQNMRTGAELLRHLSQKNTIDDEAKDMLALLIYCLREIDEGIDSSAQAWEKRDYWMKAEEFRQRWRWGHGRRTPGTGLRGSLAASARIDGQAVSEVQRHQDQQIYAQALSLAG